MKPLINCRLFNSLLLLAAHTCTDCIVPTAHDLCTECSTDEPDEPTDEHSSQLTDTKTKTHRTSKHKTRTTKSTVDSGATIHCIKDRHLFTHLDNTRKIQLKVANGQTMWSQGVGDCKIKVRDSNGRLSDLILRNCVYSPHFSSNLISTRRLWLDNKVSAHFGNTNYLKDHHTFQKYFFDFDNKYILNSTFRATHTIDLAAEVIDSQTLHSRFNHTSPRTLLKLHTRCTGIEPSTGKHDHNDCPACKQGGARKKPFPKRFSNKFSYFGERISSDLCGPFPKSVHGDLYAICFIDSATNYLWVKTLKTKASAEVKQAFEEYLAEVKHLLPTDPSKPVRWHTDNGGEFISSDLDEFCNEFGIKRSFSVPYAPPQNSHAERVWGLLLRPTRTMLSQSGVHEKFWTYAIKHACTVHNVLPTSKNHDDISPHEAVHGTKPDVSLFRVWGCMSYYLVPDHLLKSKLSPRAWPGIHLGFDPQRNGYLIYIPHLNKIATGYHVTFQETRFLNFHEGGISNLPRIPKPLKGKHHLYKEARDIPTHPPREITPHSDRGSYYNFDESDRDESDSNSNNSDNDNDDDIDPTDRRPTRVGTYTHNPPRETRNPNPNHSERAPLPTVRLRLRHPTPSPNYTSIVIEDVSQTTFDIDIDEKLGDLNVPKTYDEALKSRQKDRWVKSMTKEITDLMKHETWELVSIKDVPKGRKITKSRWCYTIKYNRDGTVERFKSRFVACGYSQIKGVDFEHTFSATLRSTSFRILMAISAGEKLKLEHFDVTSAFTQSKIDAEIYVDPPKGFETKDSNGNKQVLKLKRALYGTKQASRLWQETLTKHLVDKMGFKQCKNDPCLFIKRQGEGVCILGVYVDDIIVAHNGVMLDWFIKGFTGDGGFNSKHLGPLSWFLGMAIDQNESDKSITINQGKYIEKMVAKFITSSKAREYKPAMPCDPASFQKLRCANNDGERDRVSKLPYLELIGSLLYLSTMTRPDIAYHMSVLCSFMHDPTAECFDAAIELLHYVSTTQHQFIRYSGSTSAPDSMPHLKGQISKSGGLVAYSDASWHKGDELGYNMFGYVVYLYGGVISYAAKRLKIVALSSAEAEYAAASYTCKEVVFVRNVCYELGVPLDGPIVLGVDNQAAIRIAEDRGVTARNKHFQDAIHYIRELIDFAYVRLCFVRTHNQRADGFTKPLAKPQFREWSSKLLGGVNT